MDSHSALDGRKEVCYLLKLICIQAEILHCSHPLIVTVRHAINTLLTVCWPQLSCPFLPVSLPFPAPPPNLSQASSPTSRRTFSTEGKVTEIDRRVAAGALEGGPCSCCCTSQSIERSLADVSRPDCREGSVPAKLVGIVPLCQ